MFKVDITYANAVATDEQRAQAWRALMDSTGGLADAIGDASQVLCDRVAYALDKRRRELADALIAHGGEDNCDEADYLMRGFEQDCCMHLVGGVSVADAYLSCAAARLTRPPR